MTDATAGTTIPAPEKTWFGQPPGVTVLFLTETWEYFSFYGMRTLLVFYMTKQLMFAQEQASMVYGLYSGFVYFTPLLGGMFSDRFLTRRTAILLGGSIMALGHFTLLSEALFYVGLGLIILGNAFFQPNLPSQIASLFPPGDPRVGSAYNVYYAGLNLGSFIAPLICGTIGEVYGWHYGFSAAGVGMLLGLVIYVAGGRWLPRENLAERRMARAASKAAAAAAAAMPSPADGQLRQRILVLITVWLVMVLFRSSYEQIGNTVQLWINSHVDRTVTDTLSVPATWFQALNGLFVVTLTPLLVIWWNRTAKGPERPVRRMATGMAISSTAYLLLAAFAWRAELTLAPTHWSFVPVFFFVLTYGELFILPIGIGLFGRMAPARLAATMIAVWYLAKFAGNLLGGVVGTLWSRLTPPEYFLVLTAIIVASSLLLFLVDQFAKRLTLVTAAPAKG